MDRKAEHIRQERERIRAGRLRGLGRLVLYYNQDFSVEDVNAFTFLPAAVDPMQKMSVLTRGTVQMVKWKGCVDPTAVNIFARVETGKTV